MGDIATVGRIGGKALGWFIFASLISLTLGLVLVQLFEPGRAMQLAIPEGDAASGVAGERAVGRGLHRAHDPDQHRRRDVAATRSCRSWCSRCSSAVAMVAIGERSTTVVDVLDAVAHVMLKVTGYVMLFAPLAVFGALAEHRVEAGARDHRASTACSWASSTSAW